MSAARVLAGAEPGHQLFETGAGGGGEGPTRVLPRVDLVAYQARRRPPGSAPEAPVSGLGVRAALRIVLDV
jgi:hypothetical protein